MLHFCLLLLSQKCSPLLPLCPSQPTALRWATGHREASLNLLPFRWCFLSRG